MNRRKYIRTAGVAATVGVLSGCASLNRSSDESETPRADNQASPEILFAGLLVPTVAIKLSDEDVWTPRRLRAGRTGDITGTEIAKVGRKVNAPGLATNWGPVEDVTVPGWLQEALDKTGREIDTKDTYYNIPCKYVDSSRNGLEYNDALRSEASMRGRTTNILGDGFPCDVSKNNDKIPLILELDESGSGGYAKAIGNPQFKIPFARNSLFRPQASSAPNWQSVGNSGGLVLSTERKYAAIRTQRDNLQDALLDGYERLKTLQALTNVVFSTGVSAASSGGPLALNFAIELSKSYLESVEGVPASEEGLLLESLNQGIWWGIDFILDGERYQPGRGDRLPDGTQLNQNEVVSGMNRAEVINGHAFFPPVTEEMANLDWEIEDSAATTDINPSQTGVGFSGPVCIIRGRNIDNSTPSGTEKPTTRAQTETFTGSGELDRTLIVIGSGPLTAYKITVSGEIKQVDETLKGRSVSKQRSDDVFGSTVQGEVFDGADGFRFSGEITDISFPADPGDAPDSVTILVDGEEWKE